MLCYVFINVKNFPVIHQVLPTIKDGVVTDWDMVESVWDHALRYLLAAQRSHF